MELILNVEKSHGPFFLQAACVLTGERTGIFGPSGGGKSTLVRMIAGLEAPDRGEIVLNGDRLFCSRDKKNLFPEERRIAVVFQQAALFPHLSVNDNLFYGYRRAPRQNRSIDARHLIRLLHLDDLLARGVNHLSGGEKQRVALGRAILSHPRLLLMDEPLSALDDQLRYRIIPYLRSVNEEFRIPYLFISHSLTEMRLMTETAVLVRHNRVESPVSTEALARTRLTEEGGGYVNLLRLRGGAEKDGLFVYPFGSAQLALWQGGGDGLFELKAKEILILKGRPEAISARNLLAGKIAALFSINDRVGIELDCGGETLVATVVPQAADELQLQTGMTVYAVIKASAFCRLY